MFVNKNIFVYVCRKKSIMTVVELRQELQDIPDDFEVVAFIDSNRPVKKLYGIKQAEGVIAVDPVSRKTIKNFRLGIFFDKKRYIG